MLSRQKRLSHLLPRLGNFEIARVAAVMSGVRGGAAAPRMGKAHYTPDQDKPLFLVLSHPFSYMHKDLSVQFFLGKKETNC